MRLRIIAEQGVVVANPGTVKSKLSGLMGKKSHKEINHNELRKHINQHARFINDPNGDIIYIAETPEELQNIEISQSAKGDEILSVRDLIKRLDPKTFRDNTPPKIYILGKIKS